jgi:hypothetical protein
LNFSVKFVELAVIGGAAKFISPLPTYLINLTLCVGA